jgi:hypothetical protein
MIKLREPSVDMFRAQSYFNSIAHFSLHEHSITASTLLFTYSSLREKVQFFFVSLGIRHIIRIFQAFSRVVIQRRQSSRLPKLLNNSREFSLL